MFYNHYIRVDENNNVIKSFSTAFEQPEEGDILIAENTPERQYNLDLFTIDARYRLKYENEEIIEKTDEEIYDLDYKKRQRVIDTDIKTKQLILNGFTYNSVDFSLSLEAQSNWSSLYIKANAGRYLPGDWPLTVTTKNDDQYQIPDQDTLIAIYETGMSKKQGYIDSGRDLKIQINSASTVVELDAIEDNRI